MPHDSQLDRETPLYRPARLFTVEQANAMLPLVRAIVADIATLASELQERRGRLAAMTEGRELEEGNPYDDELSQVERDLQQDEERIRGYLQELADLHVELKDPFTGLVDFPHERGGRVVYLCWRLGEGNIEHWHELDAGFAGRQPLGPQLTRP